MWPVSDVLLALVVEFVYWIFFDYLVRISIEQATKKSDQELREEYPYFTYPLYKKLFLLGYKKAMPRSLLAIFWIVNILGIIYIVSSFVYVFFQSVIFCDIIKVMLVAEGILLNIKDTVFLFVRKKINL